MRYINKHVKVLQKENQGYRSDNARKVNSERYPDGYMYIIRLKGHDIYKIGVSRNPKRRINDIKSSNPFDIEIKYLKFYKDVYQLEKLVLDRVEINKIKGEWFYSVQ
jgi:hypothetical protein